MTKLKLYKQHPCIQLAHLYEHMDIDVVINYLRSREIFRGLDYDLSGATFEDGGIIEIVLLAHTNKAKSQASKLPKLEITFDKIGENISKAFNQILAEEPYKLFITDYEDVINELKILNSQHWQASKPTQKNYQNNNPIHLTNEPQEDTEELTLEIKPNQHLVENHQNLLQEASEWSRLLLNTFQVWFHRNTACIEVRFKSTMIIVLPVNYLSHL